MDYICRPLLKLVYSHLTERKQCIVLQWTCIDINTLLTYFNITRCYVFILFLSIFFVNLKQSDNKSMEIKTHEYYEENLG